MIWNGIIIYFFPHQQQQQMKIEDNVGKKLETHSSFDEYDDFTPTHPKPKESKHRRGNSLFNSDIDMNIDSIAVYEGISLESIKLN